MPSYIITGTTWKKSLSLLTTSATTKTLNPINHTDCHPNPLRHLFPFRVSTGPDVDADLFRRELAPRLATVGRNVTLYASSDDEALKVSKQLHGGYPRAGESGPSLVITPYIETVDVSGIDLSLLGHSYYGDNQSILRDLFGIVRQRMSASERPTVTAQYRADQAYFILR